jgi:hypothetical protein
MQGLATVELNLFQMTYSCTAPLLSDTGMYPTVRGGFASCGPSVAIRPNPNSRGERAAAALPAKCRAARAVYPVGFAVDILRACYRRSSDELRVEARLHTCLQVS